MSSRIAISSVQVQVGLFY